MRKINKGPEPVKWKQYRKTPGVKYQSIPELRDSLLKEQGYICAYCMRKVPHKDKNSTEDSRIEHIKCREKYPEEELVYSNMVICCPGAINSDFHCDKKKGTEDISFTPFDQCFIDSLSYSSSNGKIKSSVSEWDTEIDKVLNLNNTLLKKNRLEVLDAVIHELKKKKSWRKGTIDKLLASWNNLDDNGQLKPYNGIVVWYLRKKLKNI